MSLQKLIDELTDRAKNANAKLVDIYIEPDELLKLCQVAEVMRKSLVFDCKSCVSCKARDAIAKADQICAEVE